MFFRSLLLQALVAKLKAGAGGGLAAGGGGGGGGLSAQGGAGGVSGGAGGMGLGGGKDSKYGMGPGGDGAAKGTSEGDVITTVLSTTGALATVAGIGYSRYVGEVLPLLVDAVQDGGGSAKKRNVAVRTLGQVVASTGTVISPYLDFPQLLQVRRGARFPVN